MTTQKITLWDGTDGSGSPRNKLFRSLLEQLGFDPKERHGAHGRYVSVELEVEEAQAWSHDGWAVSSTVCIGPEDISIDDDATPDKETEQ
jgi:hypothetical protein